jgi:hypothetical protein
MNNCIWHIFFFGLVDVGYKKNKMSTDRESGRGNKRARVIRGSWNPKHGQR